MELGHCQVCEVKLGSRMHNFYSRTEKVNFDGESEVITVLHGLHQMSFCSKGCWEAIEEAITEGLHPLYQPLRAVATCCECRKPVDRNQAHYTPYIGEMEDVSQPWLASIRIVDEKEIAVFCPGWRIPEGIW